MILDQVLQVQIKNSFSVGQNQAWSVSDTLVPRGTIPRIQRTQEGLSLPQTVHISFPVEITPIQSVAVIGPGESAQIQWRVTNKSNKNFLGLGGALRKLKTTLSRIGGDASSAAIKNFNIAGNETTNGTSFLNTITDLKARESVIIAGALDFSDQAEPYTYVDLQSSLGLEILGTQNFATIMTHGHRITISQTYRHTPEAAVVVLTNAKTTREEYSAWVKLFADLGLKADVWDMSYNRELNLVKDLMDGNKGKSLIKNYQGKTMVLLNNEMTELNNQRALRMLSRAQFFEAASAYDINFYVLGGDAEVLKTQIIGMHLSPNRLAPVAGNMEQFIKAIEASEFKEGPMVFSNSDRLSYQELNKTLRQRPDLNYSLVFTEAGRTPKLNVFPSLSLLNGRMIAQPASTRDSQSSRFILSPKNVRPFVLALGLKDKLKSLNHLAQLENENYLPAITSAVIHDVIEAAYIYKATSNTKVKSEQMAKLQMVLTDLSTANLPTKSKEYVSRIVAALSYFASLAGDSELKNISESFSAKLDEPSKIIFAKYIKSYEEFSAQRQKALPVNFEKVFDTYKMFTLAAIGRAVSQSNTLFIKSSHVFKAGQ